MNKTEKKSVNYSFRHLLYEIKIELTLCSQTNFHYICGFKDMR